MKRFLALLLTLVMLVSVCGLQAFAADGDTTAVTSWSSIRAPAQRGHSMSAIHFRIPIGFG